MRCKELTTLKTLCLAAAFAVSASHLTGCGTPSRQFVRPSSDEVVLGKTRYSDIIAKYGSPSEEYVLTETQSRLRHVSYTHLRSEEDPVTPGIVPVRSMAFYFHGDVLVMESFYSTLKSDHTDFDETQRSRIEKGKTKLADVIALLGRPAVRAIEFLGREQDKQLRVGYHFLTFTDAIPSKTTRKALSIFIGANDVVTDVQYEVVSR